MADVNPFDVFTEGNRNIAAQTRDANTQRLQSQQGSIQDVLARRAAIDAINLENERGANTASNTAIGLGVVGPRGGKLTGIDVMPNASNLLEAMRGADTYNKIGSGAQSFANAGIYPESPTIPAKVPTDKLTIGPSPILASAIAGKPTVTVTDTDKNTAKAQQPGGKGSVKKEETQSIVRKLPDEAMESIKQFFSPGRGKTGASTTKAVEPEVIPNAIAPASIASAILKGDPSFKMFPIGTSIVVDADGNVYSSIKGRSPKRVGTYPQAKGLAKPGEMLEIGSRQ